jgi:hypothetical protein
VAKDHTASAITPEFDKVFGYDASAGAVVIAGSQGGSRGLWYVSRRNGTTCRLAAGDWSDAVLSPSGDIVAAVHQDGSGSSIRTLTLQC